MSLPPWLLWGALSALVLSIAVAVRSARYRFVSVNLAAAALAVLLFLGYDWLANRNIEHFEPASWSAPHPDLGNVPRPNQTLRWSRKVGFTDVFDITVTTNAHGFRVTPPAPNATRSVLFFGCSYTFGHGVEDDETFPYRVGVALGGDVATYNISFNGWGPHEMLSALQSGLVEEMVNEPPELVVFLTITDHVRRVIGRDEAPWMARAPRFVLEQGAVVRKGTFEDDSTRTPVSRLDPGYWVSFAPDDVALYAAVVKTARDEVLHRFPDARFEVILWDLPGNPMRSPVVDALGAHGIQPHLSDAFLDADSNQPYKYLISPKEQHPNPESLRLLAGFVETTLLKKHD